MKYLSIFTIRLLGGLHLVLHLSSCSQWNSAPTRVVQDYGNSVRNMVVDSTYNGYKSQHPASYTPAGIEGQKAAVILQRSYQSDIGSPQRVRSAAQLNITNQGGGGSGTAQSATP